MRVHIYVNVGLFMLLKVNSKRGNFSVMYSSKNLHCMSTRAHVYDNDNNKETLLPFCTENEDYRNIFVMS